MINSNGTTRNGTPAGFRVGSEAPPMVIQKSNGSHLINTMRLHYVYFSNIHAVVVVYIIRNETLVGLRSVRSYRQRQDRFCERHL